MQHESLPILLSGMQIFHQNEWLFDHAVLIENNSIAAILKKNDLSSLRAVKHYQFEHADYLVPGFIDLHIHGTNGSDVMDATPYALENISQSLAKEGVTGFLATTMTEPFLNIKNALKNIAYVKKTRKNLGILGVHLEGPFISEIKLGAQKNAVIMPNIDIFNQLQFTADNEIKVVTLAPELPNSLLFIKELCLQDVIVSIGHTEASYLETIKAIEAGSTQATHLFNAMRGILQREPGAVGALLLSKQVNTEIIVDGIHLHPAIVKLIYQLKGKNHILLVTDAMRAKCLGDGFYELGGQEVEVKDHCAKLADGTLAGSTLSMTTAIKNMMQFTDCSLLDVIPMASTNPAHVLGLEKKGKIAKHFDADLVVLNKNYDVIFCMRQGEVIFSQLM